MSFWRSKLKGATFLGRLRRDVRGNTMAIMAAALIPMIAMIGSGVDMTRAYVAQNRLSQACDAGSLAGRRLLAGTTITDAIRTETTKYFQFNFRREDFQANPYTLTITAPQTGTLHVETATTIPTTLMKFFGFQTLDISASCSATQDFINTDIMLVFDNSGSMNCFPGVPGGCSTEQTGSKIQALRDAAISLYDTLKPAQDQLHANSLRLRYGFMNYNSTVNVGRILYSRNPAWFVGAPNYQSRTANLVDATGFFGNKSACEGAYLYSNQASSVDRSYTGIYGGWWRAGRCQVVVTTTSDPDGYTYQSRSVDAATMTAYLSSTTDDPTPSWPMIFPANSNRSGIYSTSVWNGCIEERQTNNVTIDGGSATYPPSDAWDLNIDKIPDSDATRWRPMWPDIEFRGSAAHPSFSCPSEARRLQEYWNNRASFTNYVNGLRAEGSTYHDLGMIWGARFLSQDGLFAASPADTNDVNVQDNPKTIRGFSVKKYMIFMTDGDMAPDNNIYSAYGIESLDRRVTNGNGNLLNRHLQRFRMACNAAKAKGIDIWVIAFATTLTTDMQNCASKPEQASGLATRDALIAKFQEIGSKIGSLRLSQ